MKKREGKKRFNKKKFLKVCGIILAVIVAVSGITAIVTAIVNTNLQKSHLEYIKTFDAAEYENRLVPQKDEDGVWTFTTDGEIRVMQLTDVHIGGGWMSKRNDISAFNAVAAMIQAEKPDLVIITGDIAFPVPFKAGSFNNMNPANLFAELMEKLGVYWMPVFGNHDTEKYSYYDRREISQFYSDEKWEHCLFEDNSDDGVDGYCNSVINVKNSQGLITQSFYTFDSHSYIGGDFLGIFWKYDNIHDNQIEWYKNNVLKYNQYNTELIKKLASSDETLDSEDLLEKFGTVNSLAFWHIPPREYLYAWCELADAGWKDTENVKFIYGTLGETGEMVYAGVNDDLIFETMQELGSTKGIFCGHDHLNNFSVEYKGIRLTYGYSIDYLAYRGISKLGSQRGCTMITVKPDGSFDCKAENLYQEKYNKYNKSQGEEVTMQTYEFTTTPPEK